MLEVNAMRTIYENDYTSKTMSREVHLNGYTKLTPAAARAALQIAFGNEMGGEVIAWHNFIPERGWIPQRYGYRISKSGKTCRRFVAREDW